MKQRIWQLILISVLLISACKPTPLNSPLKPQVVSILPTPTKVVPPKSTRTPAPTETPSPTLTPYPTSTPYPTITPTSLPTIIPPIQSVTTDHLPSISHDLLFLRDGRLKLWNHLTAQIEILVGPETAELSFVQPVSLMIGPGAPVGSVMQFTVSDDKTKIALTRTDADPNKYDIEFFDLTTRQIKSVYQSAGQGTGVLGMSISPDGQWIAYIPQDSSSSEIRRKPVGLAISALHPLSGGGLRSGTVYAVRTDKLDKVMTVGVCSEVRDTDYSWGCSGLLWSPDSRSIAWSDGRGIWQAQLGLVAKQLVTSNLAMPNPQGHGLHIARNFSPSGRYILMTVAHYEGSSTAILDTKDGGIIPLPNSFDYAVPGPKVSWIDQDRLFVLRPGQSEGGINPSAEIWSLSSVTTTLLIRDRSTIISASLESMPVAPTQLLDGRLAFAIVNVSNSNYIDRDLYVANEDDLVLHKITGLPPMTATGEYSPQFFDTAVVWSLDNTGAIVYDRNSNQLLYVSANGRDLYDLSLVLKDACCFMWVDNR